MTADIDRLKSLVNLADVVNDEHPLTNGNGRYRQGLQHNSLVIDTAKQEYWWNSKGEHGDTLDWLGRYRLGYGDAWNSHDPALFKEAVVALAGLAGQPAPAFKPEDAEARARRLSKQKLLDLAGDHYRKRFLESDQAQRYAAGRGLTEETTARARLGYSDGRLIEQIAPDDRALAGEIGLLKERNGRTVDVIPPGCLVYPHLARGRIMYFSGRSLREKRHFNMAGPKEVFWAIPAGYGGDLVIVEGQADALSVAQLGAAGLALCGVNLSALDLDAVKLFNNVYLAIDADAAGAKNLDKLAPAIHPLVRLLDFPPVYLLAGQKRAKDANDLLIAGATPADLGRWQGRAETYLSRVIDQTAGAQEGGRDELMQKLFLLLARLEPFPLTRYRSLTCDKLKLNRLDFDRFLAVARHDDRPENSFFKGEQYLVKDGWTIAQKPTGNGQPALIPLANASFTIRELICHDNGSGELYQEYVIAGQTAGGKGLAAQTVPTGEFEAMKWVSEKYPHVVIEAGRSTKDMFRTAIQHLSGEFPRRVKYEHTGWREIGGHRCYLTTAGALGLPKDYKDTIEVDLRAGRPETHLSRYALPAEPENLIDACLASLNYWHITDATATVSLWAAAYLVPLAPFLPADFGMWLHGKTGSYKSVLAALALAHFGEWSGRYAKDRLPGNFLSTVNNLFMDAFLTKDILYVIDDYAPGNTPREMRERDEVASRLLRSLGNKAARGRMKDGQRYQASYPPRCLAIITAEDVPPGQSILARGVGVRVITAPPGSPERGRIIERITRAQNTDSQLYRHAMSGYIAWIARHWDELAAQLPAIAVEHSKKLGAVGHARLADAFGKLMAAVDTALVFFQDAGAINESQAGERRAVAWAALQAIIAEHAGQIEALDPCLVFAQTLRENLDAYDWYMEPAANDEPAAVTTDPLQAGWRDDVYVHLLPKHARQIGWYDRDYIYLLPKTVNLVMEAYRQQGSPFPVGRNTLYHRLQEKNWIEAGPTQSTITAYIPRLDTSPRVLKLLKNVVYPEGEN